MKKVLTVILFCLSISISYSSMVCLPGLSGGGSWDCFYSRGSCSGTWGTCGCTGCNSGGSSSGCNSCCCVATLALPATNCPGCVLSENAFGHLMLTISGGTAKDLGAASSLDITNGNLLQFTVDQTKKEVSFKVYAGGTLYQQVQTSGHITDMNAAYIKTIVVSYT